MSIFLDDTSAVPALQDWGYTRIGIATKFTEAKTEAKIYDIFLKKCVYIFAFFLIRYIQ